MPDNLGGGKIGTFQSGNRYSQGFFSFPRSSLERGILMTFLALMEFPYFISSRPGLPAAPPERLLRLRRHPAPVPKMPVPLFPVPLRRNVARRTFAIARDPSPLFLWSFPGS